MHIAKKQPRKMTYLHITYKTILSTQIAKFTFSESVNNNKITYNFFKGLN